MNKKFDKRRGLQKKDSPTPKYFRPQKRLRQGRGKVKTMSGQGQGKDINAWSSMQDQGKVRARTKKDQGKVKASSE